ncbi:MAG TPA: shikimate dehydrogenase [Chthoniobacterales bacterium]|nr:shikimate dehydrogenase [Chthoniobacterales bacterium]
MSTIPLNTKSDRLLWTIDHLRSSIPDPLPADIGLAVLGDPVSHSLSPEMQNAGLAARAIPFQYARIWVKSGELAEVFSLLRERKFIGWNLTVPHKVAALGLVDLIDPTAGRVGAINTVINRSGSLVGFNTDGVGLIAALRESFALDLKNTRIALLGAGGGAGMSAAVFLLEEKPKQLLLANRTLAKLDRLRDAIGHDDKVSFWAWESLGEVFAQADLIINASSVGLEGQGLDWDSRWLERRHRVFDMMYGSEPTPVVSWAAAAGVSAIDGASMLLHQGTAAFRHWFGTPVPETAMREALYRHLGGRIVTR